MTQLPLDRFAWLSRVQGRYRPLVLIFMAMAIAGLAGYAIGKNAQVIRALLFRSSYTNLAQGAQWAAGDKSALGIAAARPLPWADGSLGWQPLPTALQSLEAVRIALPTIQGRGGAIASAGNRILFATPSGAISRLDADGTIVPFDVELPMGLKELDRSRFAADRRFRKDFVRVLDLLLLPDTQGYRLFVSHHAYVDECIEVRVSSITLGADLLPTGRFTKVTAAKPCLGAIPIKANPDNSFVGTNSGGRMIEGQHGEILLSIGDHGQNGVDAPLALDGTDLGRIVAVDIKTGHLREFARGMRNPQGLTRSADGQIWETEHGPQGGDELNLVVEGTDYGWPKVTLGLNYGDRPWPSNPEQGRHQGYEPPVFAWVPSIGVSNLVEAPATFPLWRGDMLVASLLYRTLYRLRLENHRVLYAEPIYLGERLRDIAILADGEIAVLTDSSGIIVLRNAKLPIGADWSISAAVAARKFGGAGEATGGLSAVYTDLCGSCHALTRPTDGIGPHLVGLLGRPVGSIKTFHYSDAMSRAGGTWTIERLEAFLRNPEAIAGAKMPQLWLTPRQLDLVLQAIKEAGGPYPQ